MENCKIRKWLRAAVFLLLLLLPLLACTAEAAREVPLGWDSVRIRGQNTLPETQVGMQAVEGQNYLFLPSGLSPASLPLEYCLSGSPERIVLSGARASAQVRSGSRVNLDAFCGEGSAYDIVLTAFRGSEEVSLSLTVVPTQGLPTLFLTSEDPVHEGREWVESSPTKSNRARGTMILTDPRGKTVYGGSLTQIKGRGNSTWEAPKKPYQIKLSEKADLLETGDSRNTSKTWILLANAADSSLIRSSIVYDLSVSMGMEPGIQSRAVNLFYDGEYRGSYLLTEKVQIGPGRVDIADLEKATEKANPGVSDFDTLPVGKGQTANGAKYVFTESLASPEDLTGGYLLEMDLPNRALEERSYFVTTRNQYVVVKSPEFCSREQMDYIASRYQELEDVIFHGGVHPESGRPLEDYISVESLAQCYVINELSKNPDSYRSSSFLYKDAGSDLFHMGPVWDYDLSFGLSWGSFREVCSDPENYFTVRSRLGMALYEIPAFREAVHRLYLNRVAPLLDGLLASDALTGASKVPLRPFDAYVRELKTSAGANAILWSEPGVWEEACGQLRDYIALRHHWLRDTFRTWNSQSAEALSGYLDVSPQDWFYAPVSRATEYGILRGMENGIFLPGGTASRGQAAAVLHSMSGDTLPEPEELFEDVGLTAWYAPYVTWAHREALIRGYSDYRFGPEDPISRQDMICLLYRFLGSPPVQTHRLRDFTDSGQVAPYAVSAVEWALENHVLRGYEDHSLRPLQHITRAELASLCAGFYEQFLLHS